MNGLGGHAGLHELIDVRTPKIQIPATGALLEPVVPAPRPSAVAKTIAQLGAHFVAARANRRANGRHLSRAIAKRARRGQRDPRGSPTPAGVCDADLAARDVGEEKRHTVGHLHSQRARRIATDGRICVRRSRRRRLKIREEHLASVHLPQPDELLGLDAEPGRRLPPAFVLDERRPAQLQLTCGPAVTKARQGIGHELQAPRRAHPTKSGCRRRRIGSGHGHVGRWSLGRWVGRSVRRWALGSPPSCRSREV